MACSFEPNLLEYARSFGLASDHLAVDPLDPSYILQSRADFNVLCEHDEDLLHINCSRKFRFFEKLSAGLDAARLLSSVQRLSQHEDDNDDNEPLPRDNRAGASRLEVPVLKTDNELDVLQFTGRASQDIFNITAWHTDSEDWQDDATTWPPSAFNLARQLDAESSEEKLVVPKDVLYFIQAIVRTLPKDDGAVPELDTENRRVRNHGHNY